MTRHGQYIGIGIAALGAGERLLAVSCAGGIPVDDGSVAVGTFGDLEVHILCTGMYPVTAIGLLHLGAAGRQPGAVGTGFQGQRETGFDLRVVRCIAALFLDGEIIVGGICRCLPGEGRSAILRGLDIQNGLAGTAGIAGIQADGFVLEFVDFTADGTGIALVMGMGVRAGLICTLIAVVGLDGFDIGRPDDLDDIAAGQGRMLLDQSGGQGAAAAGIAADGVDLGAGNLIDDLHVTHAGAAVPVDEADITHLGAAGGHFAARLDDPVIQSRNAAILGNRIVLTGQNGAVADEVGAPFLSIAKLGALASLLCQGNGHHIGCAVAGQGIILQKARRPGLGVYGILLLNEPHLFRDVSCKGIDRRISQDQAEGQDAANDSI